MERARIFNKLKKPLHILTAFAVIICTAFAFPVISFADEIGTVFEVPYHSAIQATDYQTHYEETAVYAYRVGSGLSTMVLGVYHQNSSVENIYAFLKSEGSYPPKVYICSKEPFTSLYVTTWGSTNLSTVGLGSKTINSSYNETYDIYYNSVDSNKSMTDTTYWLYQNYTNIEDGFAAVNDYLDSAGSSVYDFETTVEVPSGSVAYIGIPSSGSLSVSAKTTMPMYTSIGSNTWSNVPQRVKQVSSLPDSTTTFPLAGSAVPNWTKTEPYNWLNQSKSAITSTTSWSGSNGNFLTFYNPVYYMDGSIQASTNTVYLTISGYSSIRIYPLQNDMSITAGSTSTSPTDYDGYWDATITDNGDGTGSVSYNPSEGSNLPPTPTSNQYNTGTSSSIIDYINQINQTLTNFAESFINLLKAPVAHIQQLVSAGSDFVGQLSGLYSWLPAEVYNTLTSAIILCISVGVLKVLL